MLHHMPWMTRQIGTRPALRSLCFQFFAGLSRYRRYTWTSRYTCRYNSRMRFICSAVTTPFP